MRQWPDGQVYYVVHLIVGCVFIKSVPQTGMRHGWFAWRCVGVCRCRNKLHRLGVQFEGVKRYA